MFRSSILDAPYWNRVLGANGPRGNWVLDSRSALLMNGVFGDCQLVATIAAFTFDGRPDANTHTIDSTRVSSVDRYNVATATCIDTAARAISLLGSICVFVLAGTAFASFGSAHLRSNSQNACPWRASQASECRDDGVVVL
ncbi:hypothetical protein FRC08_001964 [Ceratobasidium sp. 394]|nr:hypothetical protein FRC08_001964 [Ceratobasidium sp. 394]